MSNCHHSLAYTNRVKFEKNCFDYLPEVGHGVMYQGRAKLVTATLAPNIQVVIKCMQRCIGDSAAELQKSIDREVTILCILNNTSLNIHPILGTVSLDPYLPPSPVFKRCNEGTIMQYIKNSNIEAIPRLKLLKDIIEGIVYIHSHGIIHSDLKGSNILIDDDKHARICDFGSAFLEGCECQAGKPDSFESIFTTQYMSPELWQGDEDLPSTTMSDIWAFGCIALEVQLDTKPYGGPRSGMMALVRMAKQRLPVTPEELAPHQDSPLSVSVIELIGSCWDHEPTKRPGAREVGDRLQKILDSDLCVTDV